MAPVNRTASRTDSNLYTSNCWYSYQRSCDRLSKWQRAWLKCCFSYLVIFMKNVLYIYIHICLFYCLFILPYFASCCRHSILGIIHQRLSLLFFIQRGFTLRHSSLIFFLSLSFFWFKIDDCTNRHMKKSSTSERVINHLSGYLMSSFYITVGWEQKKGRKIAILISRINDNQRQWSHRLRWTHINA